MTNTELRARLTKINACSAALQWLGDRDAKTAYADCERGGWLIWLAVHLPNIDRKQLHLLACDIARTVLPIYEKRHPNDDRPRKAIEAKEAWVRGEITDEQLMVAQSVAEVAAKDAAKAAWYAAYAAAYAAADAAGYAAAAAAWYVTDAVKAEAANVNIIWYAAKWFEAWDSAARNQQTDLFRARFSYEQIEKGLEAL